MSRSLPITPGGNRDKSKSCLSAAALALVIAAIINLLCASSAAAAFWGSKADRFDQLESLLELKTGSTVAEIGAGDGAVSLAAAQRVGPGGRVFSTEIDPEAIDQIRRRVRAAGLENVTVVRATASDTGLPAGCCDAVFMIGVYHHFTDPLRTDASIFRALRPGGRLVIVDFRPSWLLKPWTPKGIPSNRGGHGIPEQILENEVTHSGFRIVHAYDHWGDSWFLSYFCVVFEKPGGFSATGLR